MNKQLRNDTALPSHFMTDEQQALADQAGKFFMSEFHHLNAEMDDTDDLPPSVFPKLGEMGYLGLNVPPEFGGAGLDFTSACIITEELSRASAAIGLTHVAHDNLCVNNIYRNANDDLRRKYLPGLCNGTLIGALGLTEPGAGSDALGSMRTTAKQDGDDYILNGAKIYITNGPIADLVLVYAKTSPEKGAKGISAFIVETDTPGFKVAQKLNKMGFRGSPTGELVFEDCRVPARNMVGKLDGGVAVTMSGLDLERAIVCFNALGIAQRALDISIDYAKTRQQFGKPIASFQMVQAMLADMYTQIEAARSLSLRTAAMCEGLEEGEGGRGEIHKLTAAAIYKAAEATSFVLDRAVQIHGGSGYMRDTEVNRLYRTGRVLEVGAGTQEVRKLIISGELLKNQGRNMSEAKSRRYASDLMAGQVALVTGSGSGMGRATAIEMAACGARLALFARREEPLEETAEMIRAAGGEAFVVPGDTRDEDSIETAMGRIKDHYGQLDVLVNNAGGQYIAAARDITNKGFEAVIRNNLIGSWQMTRAAADHFMYENGGSVVFVTAISARTALTGFTHTVAARAGVTGMMKTLAAEWGEYGIRLNCVAPGTIKTDALGRYPIPPEQWKKLNRSVLNRMGAAEDIAGTIIFLASKLGGFITGEDIYVDGGETLHMGHDARDMINPAMFEKRERGDGKNE